MGKVAINARIKSSAHVLVFKMAHKLLMSQPNHANFMSIVIRIIRIANLKKPYVRKGTHWVRSIR